MSENTYDRALLQAYANLWDSINGKTAPWESNPMVHATEFRVVANG